MNTSIIESLKGSWMLVSMSYENKNGETVHLYGENPIGILTYDNNGYMNAQMGFRHRSNFTTDSLGDGSSEEIISAYKSYMAYFGRYYEKEPGVIVHQVEGCLFPNWQNHNEIRYATIKNDLLIISTPEIIFDNYSIIIKAVWKR